MELVSTSTKLGQQIKSGQETELAIGLVKSTFSLELAKALSLIRVESPIAVETNTGINDDLSGVEHPVAFPIRGIENTTGEVVHSLAKWKRIRLQQLDLPVGCGIITDMRALRPDEVLSPIHSIYVDQWDWEQVISDKQRSLNYLVKVVRLIYGAMLCAECEICKVYPCVTPFLPKEITPIHAQELLDMYPNLTPKERENRITEQLGAVFIIGIGSNLSNGEPHDGRAPDYDDWSSVNSMGYNGLNGDILIWNPVLRSALELSSMGIRVNDTVLRHQLGVCDCLSREALYYHSMLLSGKLPLTIGGGIGQSRLCMLLLQKQHIGEVQAGIWSNQVRMGLLAKGIHLI